MNAPSRATRGVDPTGAPNRSTRRRARRASSKGFTLIELMVALGMTGIVAVGLYSLSAVSAQTFQQQQRVSELQLRLRSALDTIRLDVQRAGYLSSPAAQRRADPRVCPDPALQIQAVYAETPGANPTWNAAVNTFVTPRSLVLTGNYTSSDEYRVMGINGSQIYLQHKSPTYVDRILDSATFGRIFAAGRIVRVMGSNGQMQFTRISSSTYSAATSGPTSFPTLTVNPPITVLGGASSGVAGATNGCGIPGLGVGATVAPITAVRYGVENIQPEQPLAYGRLDSPVVGPAFSMKTDLVRRMVEPGMAARTFTNIAGAVRIVAEYAVDFELAGVFDEGVGVEPTLRRYSFGPDTISRLDSVLIAANNPQRIRSLIVRLSVRDRVQDPDFAFVARTAATEPLTRFRLSTATDPGAARVRTAVMEMELPNVSSRSLR